MSIDLSVCLFPYMHFCLFIWMLISISVRLSICLCGCFHIWTSVCQFVTISLSMRVSQTVGLFTVCLYACLSVFMCDNLLTCMSICLSVYPPVFLCIHLSFCVSICLSVYPTVYLCAHLSSCPSVCLPVCVSICHHVRLSVCPFVCPSEYSERFLRANHNSLELKQNMNIQWVSLVLLEQGQTIRTRQLQGSRLSTHTL